MAESCFTPFVEPSHVVMDFADAPPASVNSDVRIAWRNRNNSMAQSIRANTVQLLGGRKGPVEG